jgi:hypothetical protein
MKTMCMKIFKFGVVLIQKLENNKCMITNAHCFMELNKFIRKMKFNNLKIIDDQKLKEIQIKH